MEYLEIMFGCSSFAASIAQYTYSYMTFNYGYKVYQIYNEIINRPIHRANRRRRRHQQDQDPDLAHQRRERRRRAGHGIAQGHVERHR